MPSCRPITRIFVHRKFLHYEKDDDKYGYHVAASVLLAVKIRRACWRDKMPFRKSVLQRGSAMDTGSSFMPMLTVSSSGIGWGCLSRVLRQLASLHDTKVNKVPRSLQKKFTRLLYSRGRWIKFSCNTTDLSSSAMPGYKWHLSASLITYALLPGPHDKAD